MRGKMINKSKIFTFAVLVYNQESTVLETLESIKYQIKKFGEGYNFKIFITDDGSKDLTFLLVNNWIKKNHKLFFYSKLLANKKNMGTVYNYNVLMNCIEDEPFKIIAGDDLIGPESIFENLSNDVNVIDTFPFYKLIDEKICFSKLYLYDYFYKMKTYKNKKNLRWMRKGDFLHTPSTFYLKKLYDFGECTKWNNEFFLFEDDPTFYGMLKANNNISIIFHPNALILYRYTSFSTSTIPNKRFMDDWIKLQEIYYKESKGLEKIYFYCRKKSGSVHKFDLYKIIDRMRQAFRILYIIFMCHNEFNNFYQDYSIKINDVQIYYNDIKALSFGENIKESFKYAGD